MEQIVVPLSFSETAARFLYYQFFSGVAIDGRILAEGEKQGSVFEKNYLAGSAAREFLLTMKVIHEGIFEISRSQSPHTTPYDNQ